ncbi:hypothetical protein ACFYNO_15905 [Kitasatospora sp. NPDC006697]|uniref:hypothetical protein n=1 Tax=Kitasatospora sp. NPDC006697 TaxID=3364020 RepID=UPI0036AC1337
MSRGRHRHSSLISRALGPAAALVLTVAALAALLLSADRIVVRSVGAAAVLAVLGLALVLRQRDRAARAAAEATAARRIREEERFEEQLAEAEYAAEVAEERAARTGRRLTAEKSRLAKAETEIARLLKERAVLAAEQALKEAEAARKAAEAARPKHPVTPVAYLRASNALRALERRAELAEVQAEHLARRQARKAAAALPPARPVEAAVLPEMREKHVPAPRPAAVEAARPAAPQPVAPKPVAPQPAAPQPVAPKSAAATAERAAVAPSPVRPMLAAPGEQAAAAMLPAERQRQRPRPQAPGVRGAGFSFFDRGAALRAAAPAPSVGSVSELAQRQENAEPELSTTQVAGRQIEPTEPDLADVLGEEVGGEVPAEVVDLTPEDETELLDLGELRAERG